MTITGIRKLQESGGVKAGQYTVTEEYQVDFTGEFSAAEMLIAGGTTVSGVTLPVDRSEHPNISTIYALDISVKKDENSSANNGVGLYTVVYSSPSFEQADENPLDRDPEIQWRGTDEREVVLKDFDDVWFKNSAGDLYDPAPERAVQGCSECLISFNTTTNPAAWCTNFSNTVYNAALWGLTAGKILAGVIEASKQIEKYQGSDVIYWRVSVPLRFNANGWRLKVVDNGYRYVSSGKIINARDDQGEVVSAPVMLNGSGAKAAVAATPVYYPTDGFKIIPESSWSGLLANLPNPFL